VTTTDAGTVPEGFLQKQVELLMSGDTEALSQRYTEDAVLVRFDRIAHGRAEIKDLFDYYVKQNPEVRGLDGVAISDNVIVYEAKEVVGGKYVTAVGTLVLTNGLISRQTAVFVDPFSAS
jgi:hypothetical protein